MIFLETAQNVLAHAHPIWYNVFFYLFVGTIFLFVGIQFALLKVLKKKSSDMKLMQQQHLAKTDIMRTDHSETLQKLRVDMLKRAEERTRQWIESEKETLHVLNGVSNLLDLSEKIGRVESQKILSKIEEFQLSVNSEQIVALLGEIHEKVENIIQTGDKSHSNDKDGKTG